LIRPIYLKNDTAYDLSIPLFLHHFKGFIVSTEKLLCPFSHGPFEFKNRVFMAPMTRSRAPERVANDLMVQYYTQRASAGLIITEGTQVSEQGIGYVFTPGIHTEAQIQGWKRVTDAVHDAGGLIFAQLWHVGRVSHPEFHGGKLPLAPSAISFKGQVYTQQGPQDTVTPQEMTLDDIQQAIAQFKAGAQAAKAAGFDGVEIHGAFGYLPAQFLEDGSNQRTDQYGGSIANRARFVLDVTDAVIAVWGADRVSVRLSPRIPYNGMNDSQPEHTYLHVVEQLEARKLGILHFMEPAQLPEGVSPLAPRVRQMFSGLLLLNSAYDQHSAAKVIDQGGADAVSFGAMFLANPDLPERFKRGASLNQPDRATMYGGQAQGYVDYPSLDPAGF
jgi:N-ethylmaleimide reductase